MWRMTEIWRKGNKSWSSYILYSTKVTHRIHSLRKRSVPYLLSIWKELWHFLLRIWKISIFNFDALFFNKQLCSIDQSEMKVLVYLPLLLGCNHVCKWSVACTERQKVKGQRPLSRHLPRSSVQSRVCTSTVACTAKRHKGDTLLNSCWFIMVKNIKWCWK